MKGSSRTTLSLNIITCKYFL